MTTKSILQEAHEVIYGDREAVYGDPGKNLRAIADFWEMYLYHKYGADFPIDYNDVCAMMRLVKEARMMNSPEHRDSAVDICGYAALQERVQSVKTKTSKTGGAGDA
jgi:hypothetical protein